MASQRVVDVREAIERAPLGPFQLKVAGLSALVIMLDGYDVLCVSFAAPSLARAMGIDVADFGPVFGAGFLGLLVGSLLFSPFGDLYGRKSVLLVSIAVFGVFSLMPIFDPSYGRLLIYRFVTGLGLAGAMPSAIALTSEYAPRAQRGMFVSIMFAGFGLGAVAGGLLASRLIPAYGWQAAFWIGGIGPLMMLPIVWAFMPESATFLAAARKQPDRVADILRRVDPRTSYSPDQTFVLGEKPEKAGTVSNLFAGDRTAGTLLLWLIQFCTIFANSLVASWLPAIMTRAGMPLDIGILGTVMMQLGGVIGTISLGLLIDRLGATTLIAAAYALGAIATFLIGQVIGPAGITLVTIFVAGFLMVASQFCMNSVLAAFYPTKIRSTGVGWALGIGRFGAVLGPFLGGTMLSSGWAVASVFLSVTAAAVIAAAATVALGIVYPDQRRPIPRKRGVVVPE